MQEVTDVESRTNLPENHATQPAKAQLETQLEKAQQSVLIHLHQEQAHLQEADLLKAKALQPEEASELAKALREALQQEEASQQAETLREELQQEEASQQAEALQQAENLTARTASSLRTGRKKLPKPLLPLKQQKMEYV